MQAHAQIVQYHIQRIAGAGHSAVGHQPERAPPKLSQRFSVFPQSVLFLFDTLCRKLLYFSEVSMSFKINAKLLKYTSTSPFSLK